MPPPSSHKGDIEPPEEITSEAVRGFLTGAFRVRQPVAIFIQGHTLDCLRSFQLDY